jgi:DNA-binding Lrp family transcriptional regulator
MDDVLDAVKQLPHVMEAYLLYGTYDIIAKVEAPSNATLRDVITHTVRRLENVRATQNLVVIP